jgi:hypothetical protein
METKQLKQVTVHGTTWNVLRTYERDALETTPSSEWVELSVYQEGSRDVYRGYYNTVDNEIALYDYPLDIEGFIL